MEKTTFSEICRMMKNGGDQYKECISSVFDVMLLFFPALVCKELKVLEALSAGTDLVAAKGIVEAGKNQIKKLFQSPQPADFYSRYERAQAAQVMLVFSAFFDSMEIYLPDESREIALSGKEKIVITEKSIADYKEWLKEHSSEPASPEAREILEYPLDLPTPLESAGEYKDRLCRFYKMLTAQLLVFFEKLAVSDELSEFQKDRFFSIIDALPEAAAENYKKQYFELKAESEDFRVWADTQEHSGIEKIIDVGFERIAKLIKEYEEHNQSNGARTLEKYRKLYQGLISETIVKTGEAEFNADDDYDLIFPVKRDIFIPQKFKALRYKSDMLLEAKETWDGKDQDQIGRFLSDSLHHSVTGSLPLLILGGPGAGKTLLCQMLAAQIFAQEYHVIIIHLRDTDAGQSVVQQINEQIERDFSNKCVWDDISDPSMSKPILLIFDGYDELLQASGRTYADYVTNIARFQKKQRDFFGVQVKCIITSRTTLIDKAYIPEGSVIMKLSDFDEGRIDRWSEIWNQTNHLYFEKYQIDEFSVRSKSKVYDLAKQPLLLFMLALYDSSGNALKKEEDLSYAQLYDRLIRDFIAREQRKQPEFSSCSEKRRHEIIDKEMLKVSIAALGMYNRRILYIRGEDLEKDLDYLMHSAGGNQRQEESYEALKRSEKLLGSFFFIHHSVSREGNKKNALNKSAYEFLHNTFGEFLTADYIVSELYHKLDDFTYLKSRNKMEIWSLKGERKWVSCLSYAPLSSRPMVVKMIREWAPVCFMRKEFSEEAVLDAMETLLKTEIDRVVGGDEILCLDEVLSENGNPFRKQDYYLHTAYYSLNLISLGALLLSNGDAFSFDSRTWDRLSRLWKLAIPEEELLDFAEIFRTVRGKEFCYLRYAAGTLDSYDSQKKIPRIRRIAQSLGDNEMIALTSTILGRGPADQVLPMIEENELDISAMYMRNRCLYSIGRYYPVAVWDINEEMELFLNHCLDKSDYQDIIEYYRAVYELVKTGAGIKERYPSSQFYESFLARVCDVLNKLEGWPRYDMARNYFHLQMQNVISDLLSLVSFEIKGWKELLNTCIVREHYQIYLRTVNRLTKEIKNRENRIFKELYNKADFVTAACGCLNGIGENEYKSAKVPYAAKLIISVLKAVPISSTERTLAMIMPGMLHVLEKMNGSWTVRQQVFAIDCLGFCSQAKAELNGWQAYLKYILARISIKAVAGYSLNAAYDYCCVLKSELQLFKSNQLIYDLPEDLTDKLRMELKWLMEHKANDLTLKLNKIIQEILEI